MKLTSRRAELLSLIAFWVHVVFFLLTMLVGMRVNSLAIRVESWHYLGGVVIWLVLMLQFRQRRLAEEERLDAQQYELLRREGKDKSVFESGTVEDQFRLAQRRLVWLEKYLLPVFSVLMVIYLVGVGGWLFSIIRSQTETVVLARSEIVRQSAAFLVGFALLSFLFSRYAVGLSGQEVWRPLRAGGSYLLSNALVCFGLAIVLLLADAGYVVAEVIARHVLSVLLIVIGIEVLLNLVMDAFRPRIRGHYRRAAFESRILGLFSEPGGILRTTAHALDYQFGFKVSETWFFKLLSQAVIPLLFLELVALYLLTSLSIVPTGNVGVVERFGEPLNVEKPLASGLHVKWPWPIDQVRLFPVGQIQSIDVGFVRKDPLIDPATGRTFSDLTPILWSKEHWKEEKPFLVAVSGGSSEGASENETTGQEDRNDFDMLVVGLFIQYRIMDVAEYGYGQDQCYKDPRALLESVCNHEAVHFCARSDIASLIGSGQHETAEFFKRQIQKRLKEYHLGVEVIHAGLVAVHPPINVAESFEKVVSALQDKQGKILTAQGQASGLLSQARGESDVLLEDAKGYAFERSRLSQANANRFGKRVEAYEKGRDVYLWREYLSVLEETLPEMRKYFIASGQIDRWVYELDLKESQQPDLFEGLGMIESEKTNP